jgi:hypothetical protein
VYACGTELLLFNICALCKKCVHQLAVGTDFAAAVLISSKSALGSLGRELQQALASAVAIDIRLAPVRGNGGRSRNRGSHKTSKKARAVARKTVKRCHEKYQELRAALSAHVDPEDAAAMGIVGPIPDPSQLFKDYPDSTGWIFCGTHEEATGTAASAKADKEGYMRWAHFQSVRGEAMQSLKWMANEAHSHAAKALLCLQYAKAAADFDTNGALVGEWELGIPNFVWSEYSNFLFS